MGEIVVDMINLEKEVVDIFVVVNEFINEDEGGVMEFDE